MNGVSDTTAACPPLARRQLTRTLSAALALVLLLCASLAAANARAAAPITWSSSAVPGGGTPTAVSCASESLCVAVNHEGAALITANPMSATPSWSPALNAGQPLNAVSCAPAGLCVAVDSAGRAWVIGHASPSSLPGAGVLTGVSCPSTALCVAVDEEGHVFTTTNPSGGSWTLTGSHPGHLRAVSCASSGTVRRG